MAWFRQFQPMLLSEAVNKEIGEQWTMIESMYLKAVDEDAIWWSGFITGVAMSWYKSKLTAADFVAVTFSALETVAELSGKSALDQNLQDTFQISVKNAMECASGEWRDHPEGCFLKKRLDDGGRWAIPHAFFFSHMLPRLQTLKKRLQKAL